MYKKLEYIIAILLIIECNTVYSNSMFPGGTFSIGTFGLLLSLCYLNLKIEYMWIKQNYYIPYSIFHWNHHFIL